jgi:hypothetical protein
VDERVAVGSGNGARRAAAFEERRVGRRDVARGTADRGPAAVAGRAASAAGGLGAVLPLLDDLATGAEVAAVEWRAAAPGRPGEELELVATTTRCRLVGPGRGQVELALHLHAAGEERGEGRCTLALPAVGEAPLDAHLRTDFCARAWGELLAARLADSVAFPAATAGFDGAIELAAGDESIQLRIYKGALLEVARSTPAGPTFTLAGSEREWAALALAPRNDFMARTMRGGFSARGDRYQYVRLTKALLACWDEVRALAAGADG